MAPFRGFLQERRATGSCGRNWLFFGHRRSREDFLYRDEWRGMLADGVLTRMDVAFSRDQPSKSYVQHKLLENAGAVVDWLQDGRPSTSVVPIAMGMDVEAAMLRILEGPGREGAAALAELRREGRFLKDVY